MSDRSEKQKVRVVDDAPENIQVLIETLKGEYAVVPAVKGQKALQIAETAPVPDIILLDIMIPEGDGWIRSVQEIESEPRRQLVH